MASFGDGIAPVWDTVEKGLARTLCIFKHPSTR